MLRSRMVARVVLVWCAAAAGGAGPRAPPAGPPDGHGAAAGAGSFPYVGAVLRMARYVGAGALVHEHWLLASADGLYLVRESVRLLRVRLGSVNYKRGGSLLPVKYIRIHPYFDDRRPEYDVALLRLPRDGAGRAAAGARVLRLQRQPRAPTATHFVVAAWTPYAHQSEDGAFPDSMEKVKQGRELRAWQAHPLQAEPCRQQRAALGPPAAARTLLCLQPPPAADPCQRAAGAPVVLNGVLWGVASSWRAGDCRGPTLVNLVAAPNVSSWIDAVLRDLHWKLRRIDVEEDNYV